MILADKLIELRKKNGWSQEDVAEKLDVSRQTISKWEGAQSVPDMNRIIRLSELFGVSTDFLLKDEMELPERIETTDTDETIRRVSMEEAVSFLDFRNLSSVPPMQRAQRPLHRAQHPLQRPPANVATRPASVATPSAKVATRPVKVATRPASVAAPPGQRCISPGICCTAPQPTL